MVAQPPGVGATPPGVNLLVTSSQDTSNFPQDSSFIQCEVQLSESGKVH